MEDENRQKSGRDAEGEAPTRAEPAGRDEGATAAISDTAEREMVELMCRSQSRSLSTSRGAGTRSGTKTQSGRGSDSSQDGNRNRKRNSMEAPGEEKAGPATGTSDRTSPGGTPDSGKAKANIKERSNTPSSKGSKGKKSSTSKLDELDTEGGYKVAEREAQKQLDRTLFNAVDLGGSPPDEARGLGERPLSGSSLSSLEMPSTSIPPLHLLSSQVPPPPPASTIPPVVPTAPTPGLGGGTLHGSINLQHSTNKLPQYLSQGTYLPANTHLGVSTAGAKPSYNKGLNVPNVNVSMSPIPLWQLQTPQQPLIPQRAQHWAYGMSNLKLTDAEISTGQKIERAMRKLDDTTKSRIQKALVRIAHSADEDDKQRIIALQEKDTDQSSFDLVLHQGGDENTVMDILTRRLITHDYSSKGPNDGASRKNPRKHVK